MTWDELFWDAERLFHLAVLIWGIVTLRIILVQAGFDRLARQEAVENLKKQADDLAERANAIAKLATERDTESKRQLLVIDQKIDHNTQLTVKAAEASAVAVEVANSMNEKISETNQRLLDVAKKAR